MTQTKEHIHHGLQKLFKKDEVPAGALAASESTSSSHTGLSKLFHHHHSNKDKEAPSPAPSPAPAPSPQGPKRTASMFSLKRKNTNPLNMNSSANESRSRSNSAVQQPTQQSQLHHPQPHSPHVGPAAGHKKLSKAETFAHLQQLDTRNAAKQQLRNSRIPTNQGNNGSPAVNSPGLLNHEKIVYNPYGLNKSPTVEQPRHASFYLSGVIDGERVLSNPVANPNDYLPPNLQQAHNNLLEDFEIDVSSKKLGDGGSADVRIINSASHKKDFYALKKFTLLNKETDEDFYKRVSKEYIIHRKAATSRHVVDAMALLRIQSQGALTRGWGVVMEYCSCGDLFSLITRPGWKSAPFAEKYCLFKQISFGLKFLHEQGIAHRDMKTENILLDANGVAKLCDFGVSDYGHEIPDDLKSPVKMSTSYVGSPPYSAPEVMLLKDKSHSEAKNFAYNMFKADCWGLGMILFCLAYAGVPFQQASVNDHQYRDYQFSHKRFSSDHPNFKNNKGINKGPGSEFKWAAKFESTGASRVAWKLCDPTVSSRYTLDMLVEDPWFVGLEMCIFEDPDQEVNPFVLPGTGENAPLSPGSGTSSAANSQAPSRRSTFVGRNSHVNNNSIDNNNSNNSNSSNNINININSNSNSNNHNGNNNNTSGVSQEAYDSSYDESSQINNSFKSMLDLNEVSERMQEHNNNISSNSGAKNPASVSSSNASVHSNESTPKVRSMLDMAGGNNSNNASVSSSPQIQAQPQAQPQHSSPSNNKMPALEESDIEHEPESRQEMLEQQQLTPQRQPHGGHVPPSPSSLTNYDSFPLPPPAVQSDSLSSMPECDGEKPGDASVYSLAELKHKPLRSISDLKLSNDGTCCLGYKLRKHHHCDVSKVANKAIKR
ncbi:uncharacterized protein LODBEIA_P42250 [Lodderomyces beijingensis]|uniref:Protein kinase domain-containing protein n=1 Tax=Lodderomyces beijingensis TaxID=1775926 RepID=A0ABP0ZPB8_9ASCO